MEPNSPTDVKYPCKINEMVKDLYENYLIPPRSSILAITALTGRVVDSNEMATHILKRKIIKSVMDAHITSLTL